MTGRPFGDTYWNVRRTFEAAHPNIQRSDMEKRIEARWHPHAGSSIYPVDAEYFEGTAVLYMSEDGTKMQPRAIFYVKDSTISSVVEVVDLRDKDGNLIAEVD